ncbi:ParA family protein [Microbacterium tumbae]
MFHVKQSEQASPSHGFGTDTPLARELADLSARRRALESVHLRFDTAKTRVLTISNQKGGVGKTTTAVNIASALAGLGAKVLVIDLDPQGNASTALGVPHSAEVPSVYDVLIDDFPLADIIQQSPESENLLCAPSTIHLAGAEIELVAQVAREHRLGRALEAYLADHPLDFVIIDCPPSLGLLTINAFTAASEVFIPIQCEYYALEGLSQLLGSIQMIQKHLNPKLHLSTILLTMYDGRTRLAQQVADEVRNHFPEQVLQTVIPRSVRVSEAPSFGQTVIGYDGASAGAIAYREAAVEIAQRTAAQSSTQSKEN